MNIFLKEIKDCVTVCVTEHWKTSSQLKAHNLQNFYIAANFSRQVENTHGGSVVYVAEGVSSKELTEVSATAVERVIECCGCEMSLDNDKYTVVSVYRPDTDFGLFLSQFEVMLMKIYHKKNVIIMGDFNVRFDSDNYEKLDLCSLIDSFNFKHLINEPTRIVYGSQSCIDNVFVNFEVSECKIIHSGISDHTAQVVTVCTNAPNQKVIFRRIFSNVNIDQFLERLRGVHWGSIYEYDNTQVDNQWNKFTEIFSRIFNVSFPYKKIKLNPIKDQTYKITTEIKECKKMLDVLYTISSIDNKYKEVYKGVKKKYNALLAQNRQSRYNHRINTADNKSKVMWQIVREIKGGNESGATLKVPGEPVDIAENFNSFFIDSAADALGLLREVPYSDSIEYNNQSMLIKPITEKEVLDTVRKFNSKLSSGVDEVPTTIVKICIDTIVKPIAYVLNNSFKFGIFPESLKVALVKPVFKKGDVEKISNYRPISLLTAFSKIFEAVMSQRILSFFTSCLILNESQHSYLKGRSTQTALYQFVQGILAALESGEYTMGLFLDLSRAYDCISHDVLLIKMERYGVRGPSLQWIRSYLTNRKQKVSITKENQTVTSGIKSVSNGVPQGSIIGPILFIVYLNDLLDIIRNNNTNCEITNYADDTNLLIHSESMVDLMAKAEYYFLKAENWFLINKQILNKEKTNVVFFKTSRSTMDTPSLVSLGGGALDVSAECRFLGMRLDESLIWHHHVDYVCGKINSACYSIRMMSKYVSKNVLKTLYFANIESHIRYGIILYGNSRDINRIFVAQKRAIRILLELKALESCRGKFRQANLLTVHAVFIQECLLFLFKNKHLFSECIPQGNYNTRFHNYVYPKHRLTLFEKGPMYNCIRFYNHLPCDIKKLEDLKEFKKGVNAILVRNEPYNLLEFLNATLV